MKRLLLALLVLVGAATPVAAESLERIFSAGNEAYYQDELRQALAKYDALVEAGVEVPDLYFNLATAHARLGELGHAILYYERALWLRPGDEGTEQALATARRLLGKRRAEREGEATVRTRPPLTEALAGPFSADGLAWTLMVLNVLLFGLLLARPHIHHESTRLAATVAVPILALSVAASGGLLASKLGAGAPGERAIGRREGAPLREGPDERASVRKKARQGQRASILGSESGYLRVRLPGGSAGWMKEKDLGQIRPN